MRNPDSWNHLSRSERHALTAFFNTGLIAGMMISVCVMWAVVLIGYWWNHGG